MARERLSADSIPFRDRVGVRVAGALSVPVFGLGLGACTTEGSPDALSPTTAISSPVTPEVAVTPEALALQADARAFEGLLKGSLDEANDPEFWNGLTNAISAPQDLANSFAVERNRFNGEVLYGYWLNGRKGESVRDADVTLLDAYTNVPNSTYPTMDILCRVDAEGNLIESNGGIAQENIIPRDALESVSNIVLTDPLTDVRVGVQTDGVSHTLQAVTIRSDGEPGTLMFLRTDGGINATLIYSEDGIERLKNK